VRAARRRTQGLAEDALPNGRRGQHALADEWVDPAAFARERQVFGHRDALQHPVWDEAGVHVGWYSARYDLTVWTERGLELELARLDERKTPVRLRRRLLV
jgi:hypothetical protein